MSKLKFSVQSVLNLLGGEWPDTTGTDYQGFCFGEVDHYQLEDGMLIPYLAFNPMCGPSFKMVAILDPYPRKPTPESEGE